MKQEAKDNTNLQHAALFCPLEHSATTLDFMVLTSHNAGMCRPGDDILSVDTVTFFTHLFSWNIELEENIALKSLPRFH